MRDQMFSTACAQTLREKTYSLRHWCGKPGLTSLGTRIVVRQQTSRLVEDDDARRKVTGAGPIIFDPVVWSRLPRIRYTQGTTRNALINASEATPEEQVHASHSGKGRTRVFIEPGL